MAGAQPAVLLIPPRHPLDDVPPLVRPLVERLVPGLVLARRDHCLDPPSPAPPPDPWVAVALVAGPPARPTPAASAAVEQPPGHRWLERLGLVPLPRRDVNGDDHAAAVADEMGLGPEAASGAARRMVRRLLHPDLGPPAQPIVPAAARLARMTEPSMHHRSGSIRPS